MDLLAIARPPGERRAYFRPSAQELRKLQEGCFIEVFRSNDGASNNVKVVTDLPTEHLVQIWSV